MLACAVISRRRITTAIMRAQTATAVPATGEALQEGAAFPHSTTRLVRPGSCVTRDALLVGLISPPVDEALMVLFDQHLPFIARQMLDPLATSAGSIERHLRSGLAIDIGDGIERVGENVVDSVIAGLDPADLSVHAHPQWKLVALVSQPQPNASRRACLGKALEDGADGCDDGLIGMEQNLAVSLAPYEA